MFRPVPQWEVSKDTQLMVVSQPAQRVEFKAPAPEEKAAGFKKRKRKWSESMETKTPAEFVVTDVAATVDAVLRASDHFDVGKRFEWS